ncbi:MAG: hypothetical protein GEU90_13505 [Gemmatimonas sp.]|nr:hypothetical protein [Gemmatimonas sp.]
MRSFACLLVACCGWLVLGSAAPLAAQACLGYPTPAARLSVNPAITFADNATTFGGTVNANLPTPLGIEAGVGVTSYDNIDANGFGVSGRAGYELEAFELSACPFSGLSYARVSEDGFSVSALTIPVGFGVGTMVSAGQGLAFTLSAAPQLLYARQSVEGFDSESDVEFGVGLGAALGTERVYGGFALTLTSQDGNETVFGISLGFLLGS